MDNNKKSFNYFEKIFLKISVGLLGLGLSLFILMFIFIDYLSDSASEVANIVVVLLLSSVASFFIAVFRILKFAFVVSKRNDGSTITKSVISFFVSPVAIIVYYIIVIILAFSSCSIQ